MAASLRYPNTTSSVKSLATLQTSYLTTVGHNTNLLMNISPNMDGDVDMADMAAYTGLGQWIDATFGQPKAPGGVNFFILDSRRVLAPAPKVLGPKHISNPDFAPF